MHTGGHLVAHVTWMCASSRTAITSSPLIAPEAQASLPTRAAPRDLDEQVTPPPLEPAALKHPPGRAGGSAASPVPAAPAAQPTRPKDPSKKERMVLRRLRQDEGRCVKDAVLKKELEEQGVRGHRVLIGRLVKKGHPIEHRPGDGYVYMPQTGTP